MQEVIVLCGIPSSGKSTWAKQYIKDNPGWKRINKDELREMLDASEWSDKNEKFVIQVRDALILKALADGYNVIVDDANIHQKHEIRIKQITAGKATVSTKVFPIDLDEAIKRDSNRDKKVGQDVIKRMYRQYVDRFGVPTVEQIAMKPRERDRDLSLNPAFNPDPNKHDAIICDLDGTLALLNGRNPYDASTCENDILNIPIADVVRMYGMTGIKIILCSGREDRFRPQTESFLETHGVMYDHLFMRVTGDHRKDSTVKREIYDTQIKDRYNVICVIDDRQQVVRMYRDELNLTVFHVDWGNF